MKHLIAIATLTLATTAALGLGVHNAQATKVAGIAAVPASPSNWECLKSYFGGLKNLCSTTTSFHIPLPYTSSGYVNVSFQGAAPDAASEVGCKLMSVNEAHTSYWSTNRKYLETYGAVTSVSFGSLYYPGTGSLYLDCEIGPGGRLDLVEWNE